MYRKRYYLIHPRLFWRYCVSRPVRKFLQRGRRGWAAEDTWSFDTYLAQVISEGCTHLRNAHSYPGHLRPEEWDGILKKIALGFDGYIQGKFIWDDDVPEWTQFNESMDLFVKWFGHLWD